MTFQRLALIGCGLMGGSFALALREAGLVQTIVGFSASEKTRQRAVELKVIDQACSSVAEAVQGADLVLLAVPVGAMHSSFAAMRDVLQPNTLLMDVGSTKCDVIAAAQAALGERLSCFVPAHPIAGKEVAGIEHAESTLYQERRTILTPCKLHTRCGQPWAAT
jgi:prephenate dehydrogenase